MRGKESAWWKRNLRMTEDTFRFVCMKLRPYIQKQVYTYLKNIISILLNYIYIIISPNQETHLRSPVSVEARVAVTIWKLATNIEYRTLSEMFGLGRSTVGVIVVETCHAIATHLLPQYVSIPHGDKLKEVVEGFEAYWGFPQAAGGIDGSHIPIIRPDECVRLLQPKGLLFYHHASHGGSPWLVY